jgi:hypothetical protein
MEIDMEDLIGNDDIAIDEESEMSAVADIELQLDCRGNDRVGILCAPPRTHKSPSSRFREHESVDLVVVPHVVGQQGCAAATSMTRVSISNLRIFDVFG